MSQANTPARSPFASPVRASILITPRFEIFELSGPVDVEEQAQCTYERQLDCEISRIVNQAQADRLARPSLALAQLGGDTRWGQLMDA